VTKPAAVRAVKRGRARPLITTVADGVARISLNRPDAGNRINLELAQALCDAAADIELNDTIAVVVLAAAGPSFCLGIEDGGDWIQRVNGVEAVAGITRPVIAAIHGGAEAEGLELALACDLRVMARTARLCMPQLGSGRLPSHGGTQRLPRLIGRTRALDMLMTGRAMDAEEALATGLVSRLASRHGLAGAIEELVATLKAKGPIALRYAKEAVLNGSDLTTDQGMRLEEDLYVLLQTTQDRAEGIRAFLEKGKPVFRGR
jgi:enoyl-CoA hydratase